MLGAGLQGGGAGMGGREFSPRLSSITLIGFADFLAHSRRPALGCPVGLLKVRIGGVVAAHCRSESRGPVRPARPVNQLEGATGATNVGYLWQAVP